MSIAPQSVHSALQQKINSLQVHSSSVNVYLSLLQSLHLNDAVDVFEEKRLKKEVSEVEAIQFLRGLFIAHEQLAKKQGVMYLPQKSHSSL